MKRRFMDDVVETQHFFNDFRQLKKGVIKLYKVWVLEESKETMVAVDSTRQLSRTRNTLEMNYKALKD